MMTAPQYPKRQASGAGSGTAISCAPGKLTGSGIQGCDCLSETFMDSQWLSISRVSQPPRTGQLAREIPATPGSHTLSRSRTGPGRRLSNPDQAVRARPGRLSLANKQRLPPTRKPQSPRKPCKNRSHPS